jgi:chemotaxis signal transduction protein
VDSLSARKALLFSAGGARLAVRVSQLREIVQVAEGGGEVLSRGEPLPTAFVSTVLGLPAGPSPFALLTEGTPRAALRVEALHGIVDLGDAEVFQLPARTILPQPPPFAGAIFSRGEIALELSVATLGFAPLAPPLDRAAEPIDAAGGPGLEREIRFVRCGSAWAVPLSLLVHVIEAPRIAPVPLTPPSHLGLLYHGRALHPVLDIALLRGELPGPPPRQVLLLDAGGTGIAVAADRVLGVGEGDAAVLRPQWDTLFVA